MKEIVQGHLLLFRFYFSEGAALVAEMAAVFDRFDAKDHKYKVSRKIVDRYNHRYGELRSKLRNLNHGGPRFEPVLWSTFAIRISCILAAAFSFVGLALVLLCFQIVVAPFSFFAGIAAFGFVFPQYATHYLQFAFIQGATSLLFLLCPSLSPYCHITIDWWLILLILAADQLISLLFLYWTPIGRPVNYPVHRVLKSIFYGFLNCKTYWLLLLLCMRNTELDVLAIVAFYLMPHKIRLLAATALKAVLPPSMLHWTWPGSMFYHYHRMVHLPVVYNQSHRPHHFLHDATPFDAELYGSGLPEEWLKLAIEISLAVFVGLVPYSFSPSTIKLSIINKIGHTRLEGDHPPGENFHVDHHAHYQKNFGFITPPPLDQIFNTDHGDVSTVWTESGRFVCTKTVEADFYIMTIEPYIESRTS